MSSHAIVEPVFPVEPSAAHLARFQRDGYLAFEGLLRPGEVEELKARLSAVMRRYHDAAKEGKGSYSPPNLKGTGNYDGAGMSLEGIPSRMQWQAGFDPLQLTPEESELKVRNFYHFQHTDPAFIKLVADPRIQGFIEQLLNEPVILFQTMALAKPPHSGSEKPWHQDNAYFSYTPVDRIVGIWIALDEARVENGCMHILPGMTGSGLKHRHTFDCEIVPDRIPKENCVPVELKAGGAMFFSGMLPHETPYNNSDLRRRAMQFHYRGQSTKSVSREEYDKAFAEGDGTPASCVAAS